MLELKEAINFMEDDFDGEGNIKASSLMYHFQEIASRHAELLDAGFDELMDRHLIWVITKLKVKVYDRFNAGQKYILSTYPRPKKSVTMFRDYYIHDEAGNLLAAGMSHWCIINFETRKIEKTDIKFEGEYIDHQAFEEGIERISKSLQLIRVGEHTVVESDLDRNKHMNNCKYADMISDILGSNKYESFIINFAQEALLGDEILLYKGESKGRTVVTGKLDDNTMIFQASIK